MKAKQREHVRKAHEAPTEKGAPGRDHGGLVGGPPVPARLSGRILFAEDSPDIQRLVMLHLTKAGADVVLAENGKLAVERAVASLAQGRPFDLILTDMQMPEMDGYTATSLLRHKGWTGSIVALTAHAMSGDRERCLRAGCDDYMTKPAAKETLIATCGKWMAERRPAAPAISA